MAQDVTSSLEHPQQIEAVVSGPDGANRLFICTGYAPTVGGASPSEARETFVFHIGPTLTRQQMIRAIATASIVQFQIWAVGGTNALPQSQWRVVSADADWDDEDGRVQARIELAALGTTNVHAYIGKTAYQVTILAEIT